MEEDAPNNLLDIFSPSPLRSNDCIPMTEEFLELRDVLLATKSARFLLNILQRDSDIGAKYHPPDFPVLNPILYTNCSNL